MTTGQAISVTKDVAVDEITYDANGGKIEQKGNTGFEKTATTLIQDGAALNTVIADATSQQTWLSNEDATKAFAGWSIDGTAPIKDTSKVKASGTVALKAIWKDAKVTNATLASATASTVNNAEKWALTFANATAGAVMKYTVGTATGTVPAAGLTGIAPTATVIITTEPVAGTDLAANTETFLGYGIATTGAKATFNTWANAALSQATAESQATKPAYYSGIDSVKAAKAAGESAIKATGFATQKDWGKAVLEQKKAVLKSVADYAVSELDAKKALTKSLDGKTYSYLSDAEYNNAVAAVNAVVAAFDENENADSKFTAIKTAATTTITGAAGITGGDYAKAITFAVSSATLTSVPAADAEAAMPVSEAFAKLPAEVTAANAAEAKAAAEAAIKAYGELNAAQQKLVSSTDYAKAVATIKAADEAVANADKAAVAKVKGKTVKAKAKKATKSSLKVVKSKSGAKSTFKKTSGNSKVKVYKSGKIVVKKGLKAGKKYTVKVKATVGTQIKTVKVIVKVAK